MKTASLFLLALTMVAIPACMPRQQPLATVPFELVGEKLFLKARVSGSREIHLQFDTGAGSSVIDSVTARELRLTVRDSTMNEGAGGASVVPISVGSISIGGLTIPGVELLHLHLGEYEGIARDAVIGYDLLQRYVIRVDYDTKTMSFYDPVSFRYAGKGHVTPITIWSNCALVGADLTLLDSQRLHGSFMVDTGADLPILINTPFVERHDLMHQVGKTAQGSLTGSDGAEVTTYRGKTQKVDVAGFTFPNCPVRLADADSGTLSLSEIEGILGGPILRKFNTTFDYHGRKMYWEPTRSFSPDLR